MTQDAIAISETPPLPGLQLVQQANGALATIATDFAGDDDPAAIAGAYMNWADTANGLLKRRNAANTAWIVIGSLFERGATVYPADAIPTTDQGDILVTGIGRMVWRGGAYLPDNLPAMHRSGGTISYGTTSATVAAGKWRSKDDSVDIVLASAITKTLQSSGAWAAGNNGNGLFSGARANGVWYHFFVIANDSTGAVDAGFDTSITAANIPSGWTAYRRVASIRTNASGNVLPYIVRGPHFRLLTPIRVYQAAAPTPAWTSFNLDQVPPDVRTFAEIHTAVSTTNGFFSLNIAPPGTSYSTSVNDSAVSFVMSTIPADNAVSRVITGTSRDILIRADQSGTLTVDVLGYEDFLED